MEKRGNLKNKSSKRLSREEWLSHALQILSREGKAKLKIESLTKDLGVTKGSFYWHFKDRADFVRSLADYWARFYTTQVIDWIDQVQGDASDRLFKLIEYLFRKDIGRYEVAMRAWAAQEPEVARIVKEKDEQRLTFVRSLFAEMGFKGQELEMRTRTFVVFHSLELGSFARGTREEREKLLKLRHRFFTTPES
jgi:AcrR family transcriptional regulator